MLPLLETAVYIVYGPFLSVLTLPLMYLKTCWNSIVDAGSENKEDLYVWKVAN